MRTIQRLLCWAGWHRAHRLTDPKLFWLFQCQRCGQLVEGGKAVRR